MLSRRFENDGKENIKLNNIQINARKQLVQKLNSNKYKYEYVKCECNNDVFETLSEKDRYGLNVKTVICRNCGLIMTNPRMNQQSYNYFYDEEYRKLYNGDEKPEVLFFEGQCEKGKEIFQFIKNFVPNYKKIKNVLEIGCGAGGILKSFIDEGFNVTGIDLGHEYIEFGKDKGINLFCCSSAELLKEHRNEYDLIILSHVFEHFLSLSNELNVIKQLLSQNGMIYIEVPGIKNLHHSYNCDLLNYLQNAHTYNFSMDTLEQVLNWNGFELIYGNEQIKSIFKINERQKERPLTNYYEDNMKYLVDLEEEREIYLSEYKKECIKDKENLDSFKNQSAFKRVKDKIQSYGENDVLIYGTGMHTELLCKYLGKCPQIKGIVDKDLKRLNEIISNYRVVDLKKEINNIKLIIISSISFEKEIYNKIKYLEGYGIEIFKIYT